MGFRKWLAQKIWKPSETNNNTKESNRKAQSTNDDTYVSFNKLIIVLYLFLVLSLAGLFYVGLFHVAYYSLPLVVIFGLVFFVCALTVAAVVLHRCNFGVKIEALGLPTGSVRALIALSLIVIFAIMAIYMYGDLAPVPKELFSNVTTVFPNGTMTFTSNSTYILSEPSQAQKDFSLQTLTTVSTLVVAISSFYFGAKAVTTAQGSETPKLKTDPSGSKELHKGETLPIKLESTLKNEEIKGKIYGDPRGKLSQPQYNKFEYTPSDEAEKEVALVFSLVDRPDIKTPPLNLSIKEKTAEAPAEAKKAPKLTIDPSGSKEITDNKQFTIKVETEPKNEEVNGTADDKTKGELKKISSNQFEYQPSDKFMAEDKVTLTFTVDKHPETKQPLTVTKKEKAK